MLRLDKAGVFGLGVLTVFLIQVSTLSAGLGKEKSYGVVLQSAEHGVGFGGFYSVNMNDIFKFQVQGRFLDIVGESEMPVVDPYTGYVYRASEKNLLLVPVYIGVKYFPFIDQIANNFSPFATLQIGPDIILDTAETGSFLWRWKHVRTRVSYGIFIGIGADFILPGRSLFSVYGGYELLPMGINVDGQKEYSGMSLKIMIGKYRR